MKKLEKLEAKLERLEAKLAKLFPESVAGATAPATGREWTWDDLVPSEEMLFVKICEPSEEDCSAEESDHAGYGERDAHRPTVDLEPMKKELAATVRHFT